MQTLVQRSWAGARFRLQRNIVAPIRQKVDKPIFNYMERLMKKRSLVGDHTFFDSSKFPWIAELEKDWPDIRKELDVVLETADIPAFQQVSKPQQQLTQDNKWRTFFFSFYGHERPENYKRCPLTVEALKKIPGMKTAFFSILSPHKHIPPHRGPYNGVLRLHLALRVPKDRTNCKIRVGNDIGHWEEGRGLVFDDSYEHEVWNDTDEVRVVLFIDFLRPLPPFAAFLNRLFVKYIGSSAFIQDAVGNLNKLAGKK